MFSRNHITIRRVITAYYKWLPLHHIQDCNNKKNFWKIAAFLNNQNDVAVHSCVPSKRVLFRVIAKLSYNTTKTRNCLHKAVSSIPTTYGKLLNPNIANRIFIPLKPIKARDPFYTMDPVSRSCCAKVYTNRTLEYKCLLCKTDKILSAFFIIHSGKMMKRLL